MIARPLLVGESNSYGSDPRYALYPEPEHSAGGRLCRLVCGMSVKEYIKTFDRVNLCAGKWSMKEARDRAGSIWDEDRLTVLLGARVCAAFRVPFSPFKILQPGGAPYYVVPRERSRQLPLVVLPHPSGLSRAWNEPGAFARARQLLVEAGALAPEACTEVATEDLPDSVSTTARPARCSNCGRRGVDRLRRVRGARVREHELKAWPEPFSAVWDGRKRYEIRVDDRGFSVGDRLLLREWDRDSSAYTGRTILADVKYKTRGGEWGLPVGMCVMSIDVLMWHCPPAVEKEARRCTTCGRYDCTLRCDEVLG